MKKLITLSVISLFSACSFAQTINLNWEHYYGDAFVGTNNFDEGFAVAEDANGNYVGVGYRQSTPASGSLFGQSDFFLVKTATDGTSPVENNYGTVGQDKGYAAIRTADGNILVAGESNTKASLTKVDASGNQVFSVGFAAPGIFYGVTEVSDGYVACGYKDIGGNNKEHYVVKTDFSGTLVWEYVVSATGEQYSSSIVQASNGDYIFTGTTNPNTLGASYDGTIIRINGTGTAVVWSKTFSTASNDYGYEIIDISAGGTEAYAIGGGTNNQFVFKKIDGSGNETFTTNYNMGNSIETCYGMCRLSNGNFVMVGEGNGNGKNALVALVDASGNKVADLTIDAFSFVNDNYLWDVKETSTGKVIVCGNWSEGDANPEMYLAELTISVSTNQPPVAGADAVTTPEDTPVTVNVLSNDTDADGTINASSLSIDVAPSNGTATVVAGQIQYTPAANYNGTDVLTYRICDDMNSCVTANLTITVTPVDDAPVANDDSASGSIGTAANVNILTNDTDPDGTVSAAGGYTVDLDPNTAGIQITFTSSCGSWSYTGGVLTCTPTSAGACTLTYQLCDPSGLCDEATVTINSTNSIDEQEIKIAVYPNPVSNELHLLTGNLVASKANILSIDGKKVATLDVNNGTVQMPEMSKGIYVVEVLFSNGSTAKTNIIKE